MSNIILRHRLPNHTEGALPTVLSDILADLQARFGHRDMSFNILGIEVNQDIVPRIYFPRPKDVIIQITENAMNDFNRAVYQVAHEAVHLISPVLFGQTTVLEEGLATLFSQEFSLAHGYGAWNSGVLKYDQASDLTKQLLAIDPEIIKKARIIQPTISSITADLLTLTNSSIPAQLAIDLTHLFQV